MSIPENYPQSKPGQFIRIDCQHGLPRPIGISTQEHGKITIVIDAIGPATEWLFNQTLGSIINISEPLGNGYSAAINKHYLLIGGGVGVAPLHSVCKTHPSCDAILCYTTADQVILTDEFASLTKETIVATDDGSYGIRGRSDTVLLNHLKNNPNYEAILACGPKPMLKAVALIAKQLHITCQVSLEEYMACGIGAVKCCATMFKSGMQTICKDGPVFDAKEVIWHD